MPIELNEIMGRNVVRRRSTINRYVTDTDYLWREELHPRIDDLMGEIYDNCKFLVDERLNVDGVYGENAIWGFPVDEQSVDIVKDILYIFINDYFNFVRGRRTWVYTETEGYWTEDIIVNVISAAFIACLWDIGRNLLIENYPLVADDLRLRSGKTLSGDERENYHDSINKIGTGEEKSTTADNTRNKIIDSSDVATSDTTNSRSTNNTTTINDLYQSPQDQGVLPSKQSDSIMSRVPFQSPDTHGVEELKPNGNPLYTTLTSNNFDASTDTSSEGRTSTSKTANSRVDEKDYVKSDNINTSNTNAENNVGAKAKTNTTHERDEVLDMANVLKSFYDIFKSRLLMEIDNRMLPYFLNFRIARFTDHMHGRKEYK